MMIKISKLSRTNDKVAVSKSDLDKLIDKYETLQETYNKMVEECKPDGVIGLREMESRLCKDVFEIVKYDNPKNPLGPGYWALDYFELSDFEDRYYTLEEYDKIKHDMFKYVHHMMTGGKTID